ncbi:DUF1330 domain-containing protein [Caulobacter sp. SLTY]|uniref:DUF1330 domain-containing protein n=1 Tax=Caulobacter sp. SLTY TaxID=2683262 RepID=UPI001412D08D|nr:DUF1330 domain-containing protein [Caulobacter sp. SLTY]NBB15914.1 DUF1330 domain-containing protein [Caulobacter sp. SLTY]
MNVENAVMPRQEQLAGLLGLGGDQPIQMLNLLTFHEVAQYDDPNEPKISGREAYMRYGAPMSEFVAGKGGRIIFSAAIDHLVIGEVGEMWDVAAIMEYPSRAAFVAIATSPEVAAISHHRKAGLKGQLLIQCSPAGGL